MLWKTIGKTWTLEIEKQSVFVTHINGWTVEIKYSVKHPFETWCSNLRYYNEVPPYIRKMVDTKLWVLNKAAKKVADSEFAESDPEGYAALWGCDPKYDKAPRKPGDGYLFYNFASGEAKDRTPDNLKKFVAAIKRTIRGAKKSDKDDLYGLLDHVESLLKSEVIS